MNFTPGQKVTNKNTGEPGTIILSSEAVRESGPVCYFVEVKRSVDPEVVVVDEIDLEAVVN